MTKEEIIDNLKYQNKKHYGGQSRTLIEAIKLIEQPTSDDCVSRQAVLDLAVDYGTNSATFLVPVCSVKSLPPVTPAQKWIPIITREPTEEEKKDYFEQHGEELCYMIDSPMPDNGQEVLVSVGSLVLEDIFCEDSWDFENWDIADVEAWQPLPQPYEEKRGNENGSN